MISINNVSKIVKSDILETEILKNISFTVEEEEFITIMGPSGCGKSSLLGVLAGLDKPSKGNVSIMNKNIYEMKPNKRSKFRNENIGIIFQNFNLIPILNCIENISVPLLFSKNKDISQVKKIIDIVGLTNKVKLFPNQLSGGEQQRVAIARALIQQPKILFADEPTGSLDTKNSHNILELIKKIRHEYGTTIILVTHNEEIANLSDRTMNMLDGEIEVVNG